MTPSTVARQAPLSMGFSRQDYWSGLPCRSPGDLPRPGIKLTSPALQVDSLPLSHLRNPSNAIVRNKVNVQEKSVMDKYQLLENPQGPAIQHGELCSPLCDNLMVTRGKDGGRDSQGVWDGHGHMAVFNKENQQGPAGQLRELCSMRDGRGG